MNIERFFWARSMMAAGSGLLTLGLVIALIKLVLDSAYLIAAIMALAGLIILVIGLALRRG